MESNADIFECNQCDLKKISENELKVHIEKQHKIQALKSRIVTQCSIRDNNFSTNEEYKNHITKQ